jgi:acetolactate synthase regulatory subunit
VPGAPTPSHRVVVVLDDDLLAFNRVIGVVRRRNLPVSGIRVDNPSSTGNGGSAGGMLRFSFYIQADEGHAERLRLQLEKAHGVKSVEVSNTSEVVS